MRIKNILSLIMTATCCSTAVLASDSVPVLFDGQQDTMSYIAYNKIDKDRLVGAVSVITGEELSHSYSTNVQDAISSLALGFYNNSWKIRGNKSPMVIVDGLRNRGASTLSVDEIANVYVLRDASAKMLYGSEAADGVIVIETKRGPLSGSYIKVSGEVGTQMVNYIPEYLDSYQYAKAYTQAQMNDGLTDLLYSDADIAGYKAVVDGAEGANYLKYPNNNMYDLFMNESKSYRRADLELGGREKDVAYYVNLGYYGDSNLQKVGDAQQYDRLNVRTNVDYKINKVISAYADLMARWDMTNSAVVDNGDFISALSSHRPNEYPIFVEDWGDTSMLGKGEFNETKNLWGELTRAGYRDQDVLLAQANIGLKFNLNSITKGLSADVKAAYDSYTLLTKGQSFDYYRYQYQSDDDSLLRVDGPDDVAGQESKTSDNIFRNFGLNASVNYDRTFGKHSVLGTAVFDMQSMMAKLNKESISAYQDDNGINSGARINYSYDGRYVLELNGTLLGSSKYTKANRWGMFGGLGAAWNIHKESFMSDVDFIDKLKLKASYGKMGYDKGLDYMLYNSSFSYYTVSFGHNGSNGFSPTWYMSVVGNEALTYAVSEQTNIGLEANMFDNRLMLEANYYAENRTGIPVKTSSIIPQYVGLGTFAPVMNFDATSTRGYEIGASWGDKFGDFSYRVGGMLLYTASKYDVYEQDPYQYPHQKIAGRYTDAISGLVADGLYQNQDAITAHGISSSYGALQPGDIKYNDYIDDGVINNYDNVVIGNSAPRYSYNFRVNLAYKNLSLFMLGEGVADYDVNLYSAAMMKSTGDSKYSKFVLGAAVADAATGNIQSGATYPRLTSNKTGHSFRNSSYWLRDGGYFRFKTLQLAYDLPKAWVSKIKSQGVKVYVKGDNLFTVSKIKSEYGLDPISFNSGVTSNPTFTTIAAGLDITF